MNRSYIPYIDYGGFALGDHASLAVGLTMFAYDAEAFIACGTVTYFDSLTLSHSLRAQLCASCLPEVTKSYRQFLLILAVRLLGQFERNQKPSQQRRFSMISTASMQPWSCCWSQHQIHDIVLSQASAVLSFWQNSCVL